MPWQRKRRVHLRSPAPVTEAFVIRLASYSICSILGAFFLILYNDGVLPRWDCSDDATDIGDRKMVAASKQAKVNKMQSIRNLVRNEDGATAIEYALIASLIAMAIVAGVSAMGTQLSTVYVEIGNALN